MLLQRANFILFVAVAAFLKKFLGCAQSRGPEEMAPLFTAHPTGIWVHCDKGHKTCGLPMNKYPTCPPVPPHGCWVGPVGQGSILEEKLQYLVAEFAT